MSQSNDVDNAPEPIWPDAKLERQMLADAEVCQRPTFNYSVIRDAGMHIPALLERVRVLEAEVARLSGKEISMGHLSRLPDSNDPSKTEWRYGPQEPHDDFSALLNGIARRCTKCKRVTILNYLQDGTCPDCKAPEKP